jgi:hypothetical protein
VILRAGPDPIGGIAETPWTGEKQSFALATTEDLIFSRSQIEICDNRIVFIKERDVDQLSIGPEHDLIHITIVNEGIGPLFQDFDLETCCETTAKPAFSRQDAVLKLVLQGFDLIHGEGIGAIRIDQRMNCVMKSFQLNALAEIGHQWLRRKPKEQDGHDRAQEHREILSRVLSGFGFSQKV